MITKEFYAIIDKELNVLVEKYKDVEAISKQKKDVINQKSYALLIWFLDFYGRTSDYPSYITEGNGDGGCDIVFDRTDNRGNKIFYIVQSKWNNEANTKKETDKEVILAALSNFDTIWRGERKVANEKLTTKLNELDQHLKDNGEVKFIFLSLASYKGKADDNIATFRGSDPKIKFEVIDFNRIKLDYIERKFKKIEPTNPLESYQNPEESKILLKIESNSLIKIERPFSAYLLLLKPQTVFELFEKYGFAIFQKNVRNPLMQSQFNEKIKSTVLEEPDYFWYYNNGITAISNLLPEIGTKAEIITLSGLQIINGAQTVYAIYQAFKDASSAKREQINARMFVSLRLLQTGGKEFDLNVTRFTNSQNPVSDRDFCANDDIQINLQNESFNTPFWYEKRKDEFREKIDGITVVPNGIFANLYLAYHLQQPVMVSKNLEYFAKTGKDLNFLSYKENKDGFYEKIFNADTKFEDMHCAYLIFDFFIRRREISYEQSLTADSFHYLALFKVVFEKYLKEKYSKEKYNDDLNVTKYILKESDKEAGKPFQDLMLKVFTFILDFAASYWSVKNNLAATFDNASIFMFTQSGFDQLKEKIIASTSCEAIESTEIKPLKIQNKIKINQTPNFITKQ